MTMFYQVFWAGGRGEGVKRGKGAKKLSLLSFMFPACCKKGQKKVCLKFGKAEFLCTFAPAFKARFLGKTGKMIKKKSKKRFAGSG